jgi:hypothetical protein
MMSPVVPAYFTTSKRREKPFSCQQWMVKTAREMIDGVEKYMVYRRADLDILI